MGLPPGQRRERMPRSTIDTLAMSSVMANNRYLGTEAALREPPKIGDTYPGIGHGTPGTLPNLTLALVEAKGSDSCTP